VRADLRTSVLSNASLGGADLTGADLTAADLHTTTLGCVVQLREHREKQTVQTCVDLSGANLRGAHLEKLDLSLAGARGVVLDQAFMTGARLERASLPGASLVGTELSGANLTYVDLRDADLRHAARRGTTWRYALDQMVPSSQLPDPGPPVTVSASDCHADFFTHSKHAPVRYPNGVRSMFRNLTGRNPNHYFDGGIVPQPLHSS